MGDYYWPNGTLTQPKVISPFGMRWHPIYQKWLPHLGTDMVGFRYNRAIADGVVQKVGYVTNWTGGGYGVWVKQDDGVLTKYFHGVNGSAFVKVGQRVKARDMLSIMGMTGTADVVHLHIEISPGGGAGGQVDPVPFIKARLASSAGGDPTPIPTPEPERREEDMSRNAGVYYTNADKKIIYLLFNSDSGWQHEYSAGKPGKPMPAEYNNAVAKALDTPSWASVTEGHATVIKRGLAAVRPKDMPTDLDVRIVSDEEVEDTLKAARYHAAQAENEDVPLIA